MHAINRRSFGVIVRLLRYRFAVERRETEAFLFAAGAVFVPPSDPNYGIADR
jgi:hypothetical protein